MYDILNTATNYVAVKEGTQGIELAITLKYLGNFWRALNMPLISCEISLELKWDKNCVITSLEEKLIGTTANRYSNKYRSQMSTEAINNNLNILIDPTFTNVNRSFVLAYQTAGDRHSYSQFY